MIFERRIPLLPTGLLIATGFALMAVSPAALAQSTKSNLNGLKLSNEQPIQIESDALEIREQEKPRCSPAMSRSSRARPRCSPAT